MPLYEAELTPFYISPVFRMFFTPASLTPLYQAVRREHNRPVFRKTGRKLNRLIFTYNTVYPHRLLIWYSSVS